MLGDPCNAKKTVTRPELVRYNLFKGLTLTVLSVVTLGLAFTTGFAEEFDLFGSGDGTSEALPDDDRSPDLSGGLVAPDALVTITGQLINAATGGGVAGGEVCLQETGQCARSDDDGYFTLGDLAVAGEATLAGSADGYFETSVTLQPAARETTNQNLTLSPVMTGQATRVVLTWGTDRDYDSHLRVPGDGTNPARYVWYPSESRGAADRYPFAVLDVDDTDGLGPETVTIDSRLSGTYAYIVHDYSGNRSLADATVQLYNASGLVAEFSGPTEETDYWYVFNINGDTGDVEPVDVPMGALPDAGDFGGP